MAKLTFLKRLIKEDFKQADQELIGKIAFILNPALESITNVLTRNLTFEDNFAGQIKEVDLTVDASGKPINTTSFKSDLNGSCKNLIVTRAQNLTNTAVYPSSAPFISFSESNGQIFINNCTGLQANNKYRLRILATI